MKPPVVLEVSTDERQRVLSTTLTGFSADPLLRWIYPDAHQYLAAAPGFDAFCGGAIDCGTAFRTQHFEGAAYWHSPGQGPDEERLLAFFGSTIPGERLAQVGELFQTLGELHPESEHWYLPVIGVDPAWQGQGFGAALMKHALRLVDEAGLPAYLEASSERNAALYARHGFEATGSIQVGSSPTLIPMLRPPKGRG